MIDRAVIVPVRYHAALVEISSGVIRELLANPTIGLAAFDDAMILRPQSLVSGPVDVDLDEATPTEASGVEGELGPPVAALLDGLPMAQHTRLADRLVVDDPDDFAAQYGGAEDQRHGTAMASLIIHGDLNHPDPQPPVQHQLYVRPVMYSQQDDFGFNLEFVPSNKLGIDLVWSAFLRMYEGEDGEEPTAPTVRVVNLSIGDANRRFAGVMSPWARLVDHLAWRFGLLIIVSAGNVVDRIPLEDVGAWADFEAATYDDRQMLVLRSILQQRARRRLLSPSEAINALTVGAAHSDYIAPNGQGVLAIDPYSNPYLPNPSSALGLGFRRGVKPEILLPGGVEQVRSNSNIGPIEVRPVSTPGSFFGVGVASPGPAGETNRKINMSGTSVATALATHSAIRISDALNELPDDPVHPTIDPAFHALIVKALLVHSARWDQEATDILRPIINENGNLYWEHEREEVSRFLGFGNPIIDRVIDCTESPATLIGWDRIEGKETNRYRVPLPAELEGVDGFRAITVTIAWLTPVNMSHRMYRLAKFEVRPGSDKEFSLGVRTSRLQPSHNAVGRGTVYHRCWEGDEAVDFVDDGYLVLDVICSPVAGDIDEPIPYAVAVSLEVGAEIAVPVYERVRERLREVVRIMA